MKKPTSAAAAPAEGSVGGLTLSDASELSARFVKDIWPLMSRDDAGCVSCHGQKNASQYLLLKDAAAAFQKMLAEGHFDPENHASIVERVATTDQTVKMPPQGMTQWKPAEIALLTAFSEEVQKRVRAHGGKPDEAFPAHLTTSYAGDKTHDEGPDNTFLSFRQLRGKVKTIFNDDWRRDDRDLFLENLHLFGGADFNKRFDETTKASATFLTGVDLMGRDVASRAFLDRSGPFAGWSSVGLPSPTGMKAPDKAYTAAIDRLYQKMLFRSATPVETKEAFQFLQGVYRAQSKLRVSAAQDLRFSLSVKDDRGLLTTQDVSIEVSSNDHGLYSELIDQSKAVADDTNKQARQLLGKPFPFAPGDPGQQVVITNAGTHGNVSVAGIALRGPLLDGPEKFIPVEDSSVRPEGAWRIKKDDNFTSYDDNNESKGDSHIIFPITVAKAGMYEVSLVWRRFKPQTESKGRGGRGAPANGADNVRVEVVSRDKESRLALPDAPPVPPKGEAHFFIDQTLDTAAFWDLRTAFQFGGESDGIEIRNNNTRKRVVADAVRLVPADASTTTVSSVAGGAGVVLIKGETAAGKAKWQPFGLGTRFRAYNTVGPELFQDIDATGNKPPGLSLLYKPTLAPKEAGFDPAKFYKVGVGYPGQVENETRVPVVVRAQASSPIVQVVYPPHAHVSAPITIDASSTYNIQRSKLAFAWTQTGGPRVAIKDPAASKLSFAAPAMTAQQAAWEGLCRALMSHPDFLFTRPRSLASVTDPKTRRRLQLVKIAQDLVARTPTNAELAKVDGGAPLGAMIDEYLASPAFKDFYFHRVRLYLESHGTPEQDEPARLWTYIMMNDRPFKELFTADYSVDVDFQKQARPPYHGKTGLLTMKGFIQGKPGLPHFNYPAQVTEKFLGYVFEVPAEVLETRTGITASATTDPQSVCYSCHKVLTPLAYQRGFWDDEGNYRQHDETGLRIDATDRKLVASYPYKGNGIEAFALQAQNKERFVRTILQTQFVWYFGREMRFETDERVLYKRLWDAAAKHNYALRPVLKTILLSPEYLNGPSKTPLAPPPDKNRLAGLAAYHRKNVAGFVTAAAQKETK